MAYSPLPTPLTGNPQQSTSALPVRMAPNVSWRPNLASVIASDVDTAWWTLVGTGSGQTISQSGGKLVFTTGTTAISETIIRSKVAWQDNMLARYSITLSQRIANQFFYVELVDVIGDGVPLSMDWSSQVAVTTELLLEIRCTTGRRRMTLVSKFNVAVTPGRTAPDHAGTPL